MAVALTSAVAVRASVSPPMVVNVPLPALLDPAFSKTVSVALLPPDSEKFWWEKFFSSAVTPQGIAVAYIPRPENAALAAAKILALFDKSLQRKVEAYMRRLKEGAKAGLK